jgi:hypothetical protein
MIRLSETLDIVDEKLRQQIAEGESLRSLGVHSRMELEPVPPFLISPKPTLKGHMRRKEEGSAVLSGEYYPSNLKIESLSCRLQVGEVSDVLRTKRNRPPKHAWYSQ